MDYGILAATILFVVVSVQWLKIYRYRHEVMRLRHRLKRLKFEAEKKISPWG
jgi:hypothetical protein